jgi:hypothetical protein
MDMVIKDECPNTEYILSLDADTIFTGNILKVVVDYIDLMEHEFDIYMVKRNDPRMQLTCDYQPGSGFTLWKKNSRFINLFKKGFNDMCVSPVGGSQTLINTIKYQLIYNEIDGPYLHFISPDLKNPNLTEKQIFAFQPAYIHLHGNNAYLRLKKFERIFSEHFNGKKK